MARLADSREATSQPTAYRLNRSMIVQNQHQTPLSGPWSLVKSHAQTGWGAGDQLGHGPWRMRGLPATIGTDLAVLAQAAIHR